MQKIKLYDKINRDTPQELRNKVALEVKKLRDKPYLHLSYVVTPTSNPRDSSLDNFQYPLHFSLQKQLNAIIRYDYDRCGDKKYNHLIK